MSDIFQEQNEGLCRKNGASNVGNNRNNCVGESTTQSPWGNCEDIIQWKMGLLNVTCVLKDYYDFSVKNSPYCKFYNNPSKT